MKVTKFQAGGFESVLLGTLSGGVSSVASNAYAINGLIVEGSAASNYHMVAYSSNYARWIPHDLTGESSGRWELAVITGSPPDPLYADGDFLYIFVP